MGASLRMSKCVPARCEVEAQSAAQMSPQDRLVNASDTSFVSQTSSKHRSSTKRSTRCGAKFTTCSRGHSYGTWLVVLSVLFSFLLAGVRAVVMTAEPGNPICTCGLQEISSSADLLPNPKRLLSP